jgi:hypothetical protein
MVNVTIYTIHGSYGFFYGSYWLVQVVRLMIFCTGFSVGKKSGLPGRRPVDRPH